MTQLSLPLIFSSDATVDSWSLDSATPVATADVNFEVSVAETSSTSTTLFSTVLAVTGGTLGTYAVGTQPNAGQFAIASNGDVTLASSKTLDRETSATIIIEIV